MIRTRHCFHATCRSHSISAWISALIWRTHTKTRLRRPGSRASRMRAMVWMVARMRQKSWTTRRWWVSFWKSHPTWKLVSFSSLSKTIPSSWKTKGWPWRQGLSFGRQSSARKRRYAHWKWKCLNIQANKVYSFSMLSELHLNKVIRQSSVSSKKTHRICKA